MVTDNGDATMTVVAEMADPHALLPNPPAGRYWRHEPTARVTYDAAARKWLVAVTFEPTGK